MPPITRTHLQPFTTPTGAVVTVEDIGVGDTVLVWSHASPEAPSPPGAGRPLQHQVAGTGAP